MKVWVNGEFVDDSKATVSVFDAGFQHGVGLFETMSARHGKIFRGREHVQRLSESATTLRLTEKLHVEPLIEALVVTLGENNLEDARLRLTLTGGNLNMLQQTGEQENTDPTIVIQCQPPTKYPDEFFENGVYVSLASGRVNPYEFGVGHKTLNYWPKLLNLQLAAMCRCGEALWLTPSAHVAGGSVSNIFVIKDGTLFTPIAVGEEGEQDEPSAVLPGITRAAVIELADGLGVGTSKRAITLDDVIEADELCLTNSSWGVLPVVGLRAHVNEGGESVAQEQLVGGGGVGKLTAQLITSYNALVEEETRAVTVES